MGPTRSYSPPDVLEPTVLVRNLKDAVQTEEVERRAAGLENDDVGRDKER